MEDRGQPGKLVPLSANADFPCSEMIPPLTPPPVPWSLSWREDGELTPQDHFDLLQTLLLTESSEVQHSLVVAMERLTVSEITAISTPDVSKLCA
jgi:hypothetical protein